MIVLVLVSLIIAGSGLGMYFIAPKIGPNPWFGFRLGYTMKSEEAWNRSNKFAGMLLTIGGIFLAFVAFFIGPGEQLIFILVLSATIVLVVVLSIVRAIHIAEEVDREEIKNE